MWLVQATQSALASRPTISATVLLIWCLLASLLCFFGNGVARFGLVGPSRWLSDASCELCDMATPSEKAARGLFRSCEDQLAQHLFLHALLWLLFVFLFVFLRQCLTMWLRLSSNCPSSCPCLLSTGITQMHSTSQPGSAFHMPLH